MQDKQKLIYDLMKYEEVALTFFGHLTYQVFSLFKLNKLFYDLLPKYINFIYFHSYLSINQLQPFDCLFDQHFKNKCQNQLRKYFKAQFKQLIFQINLYQNILKQKLCSVVDDKTASTYIKQILKILIYAQIPMPKLRRQNLGQFCRTNFQMLLTQQLWEGKLYDYVQNSETMFTQLMKYLNQQWKLTVEDKQLLKSIRYQNIFSYKQSDCLILSLTQLIIVLFDKHIKSIETLIKIDLHDNQFYILFHYSIRLRNFFNSITALEVKYNHQDKLGFLNDKINELFQSQEQFQGCYKQPPFRLWRTLTKKWIKIMKPHFPQLQKAYCMQKIKQIQNIIENKMSQVTKTRQAVVTSYKSQNYFKTFSKLTKENYVFDSSSVLITASENFLDLSLNELSVHWVQHSKLQVEKIYQRFQNILIKNIENIASHYLAMVNKVDLELAHWLITIICDVFENGLRPRSKEVRKKLTINIISNYLKVSSLKTLNNDIFLEYSMQQMVEMLSNVLGINSEKQFYSEELIHLLINQAQTNLQQKIKLYIKKGEDIEQDKIDFRIQQLCQSRKIPRELEFWQRQMFSLNQQTAFSQSVSKNSLYQLSQQSHDQDIDLHQ